MGDWHKRSLGPALFQHAPVCDWVESMSTMRSGEEILIRLPARVSRDSSSCSFACQIVKGVECFFALLHSGQFYFCLVIFRSSFNVCLFFFVFVC